MQFNLYRIYKERNVAEISDSEPAILSDKFLEVNSMRLTKETFISKISGYVENRANEQTY